MLLCLQSNALKFTEKGKVEIEVKILEDEDQSLGEVVKYLQVSVIDTGAGIPYDEQDKMFKLFGFAKGTA